MNLTDKFNCITNIDDISIGKKFNMYLENYLTNDYKTLMYNYFQDIKIDSSVNLCVIIEENYLKYLKNIRNNMRQLIKKNQFNISGLFIFIDEYEKKFLHINKTVSRHIDIHVLECTINTHFINLIIFDPCVLEYIETVSIDDLLILYNKLIKKLNYETHNIVIKAVSTIIKKKIINSVDDYKIPNNMQNFIYINKTFDIIDRLRLLRSCDGLIPPCLTLVYEKLHTIILSYGMQIYEIDYIISKIYNRISMYFLAFIKTCGIYEYIINNKIDISRVLNIIRLYKDVCLYDASAYGKPKIKSLSILHNDNVIILVNIINNLILSHDKSIFSKLSIILDICKYSENKDVFIKYYYEALVKRLLYIFTNKTTITVQLAIEKHIYSYKSIFGGLLFPVEKIIKDIEDCQYENNTNIHIPILSAYWDINMREGNISSNTLVNYNTPLCKELNKVTDCYMKTHKNRTLLWFPHFGQIIVNYMDKEITMLPIHLMVLELAFDDDVLNMDKYNILLKNYSDTFKSNILKSFTISKLINNNIISTINTNLNLIEIFHNCSKITSEWESNRNIQFNYTREEITMSCINHIIKLNNLNYIELYDQLSHVNHLFQIDTVLYDSVLDKMIKNDYIKLENDKYQKIYF
jgi:hypothetical protein